MTACDFKIGNRKNSNSFLLRLAVRDKIVFQLTKSSHQYKTDEFLKQIVFSFWFSDSCDDFFSIIFQTGKSLFTTAIILGQVVRKGQLEG
jgi:hypothetical protein